MILTTAKHYGQLSFGIGCMGLWGVSDDAKEVALLFKDGLNKTPYFEGSFDRVTFAVLDNSKEKPFIGPFEEVSESKNESKD